MKTTAKDARLADLTTETNAVKGGGIKVPDAPQRVRGGQELKGPLQPCL
jgi:hypothetical protein